MSESASDLGGYKEVIARIVGGGAYSKLKFESGGHRVQRVPETEAQGRIHTSACTVAVLPEADPDRRHHDQSRRPSHRHVPRVGRRRAAREQDRLRSAHHPPADGHRRRVPGRSLAASQPRAGDGGAGVAPRRQAAAGAAAEGGGAPQEPDRLGRSQRADPHLQLSAGPRDRPPDQPHAVQDRRDHGRRSRRADRPRWRRNSRPSSSRRSRERSDEAFPSPRPSPRSRGAREHDARDAEARAAAVRSGRRRRAADDGWRRARDALHRHRARPADARRSRGVDRPHHGLRGTPSRHVAAACE